MAGCFSCFPRSAKIVSGPLPLSNTTSRTSYEDEKGSPTTTEYTIRASKEAAAALGSVAGILPVPGLSEFVMVAIKTATAIEESVKVVQRRVHRLMLRIRDAIPVGGSASKDLQASIKHLQSILDEIRKNLDKIKQQKRWLLIVFGDLNKGKVSNCVTLLDVALQEFQFSHAIRAENRTEEILSTIKLNGSAAAEQLVNVTEALVQIEKKVDDIKKPHTAPTTLQDIPPRREIFVGRQSAVREIASLLAAEATSRHQFWVPCVEAKSADLLRRILYAQLRITADSYDTLEPLIMELDASKDRRVLLLDNFETPWLSRDQDKVRDILFRLAKLPHITLLVTMTSAFPPSDDIEWYHQKLPSLDRIAAIAAFKKIYPGVADDGPKLDELLDAIDRIPLAIVLMANAGKHLRLSPEYLLDQWKKTGTGMISNMDRTIAMSVNREFVASNPEASTLLAVLSMLPAGTTGSNLAWWTPTLASHIAAIDILLTAALIEQSGEVFETSRIFVRPTIQSYMGQQQRIPMKIRQQVEDICYQYVLVYKSSPDDAKFMGDVLALGREQTNIQSLLMQVDAQTLRPHALEALIAFSLYQSRTKPSTVVGLHALKVARATQNMLQVAEAHRCLGKIFLRLDDYEEACRHFQKACRGFKSLPDGPDRLRVGECSMDLAETWMLMSRNPSDIRDIVLEAKADLSYDESDRYHVARGLLGLGAFLFWFDHKDSEVLEALDPAKEIFEDMECPASTSECLYLMARIYTRRNDYAQALPIAKHALAHAERAGDEFRIGETLQIVAANLICLGSHDEALGFTARALSTTQSLGSPLGIAQTLELLAYNCAAKLDISGARAAYEGAQARFNNVTSVLGEKNKVYCTLESRRDSWFMRHKESDAHDREARPAQPRVVREHCLHVVARRRQALNLQNDGNRFQRRLRKTVSLLATIVAQCAPYTTRDVPHAVKGQPYLNMLRSRTSTGGTRALDCARGFSDPAVTRAHRTTSEPQIRDKPVGSPEDGKERKEKKRHTGMDSTREAQKGACKRTEQASKDALEEMKSRRPGAIQIFAK
ncbi:hypothetical protein B0H19DRAFT_1073485 [Mycena capillaripes]|nr:hypothetical protein B0H19DRAFT_1073485 [Mycena capillaripes]